MCSDPYYLNAQEIVDADDAAENMSPRRVFVRNVYRIREKYGEEIKKIRKQYNEALEQAKKGAKRNWVRGCDSIREQMNALYGMYHKLDLLSDLEKDESIKSRLDSVYYEATDNCPSVTAKQVLEGRLYDLSEQQERGLRQSLKDLEEKEDRFLRKLKTLEDYINFNYPQAPSIPVSPVSDWKNILYAKFDEEISSILKSCYVEVEQIPPQIRNFLERCGYKTGDKVVIFSSLKALETLPLTDKQLQNYKYLIQNKDARKKFIHNFWHDENRVQFELNVLKQSDGPTKVQAALDSFVQSLQSLAEDPYWGDCIIYLHAVLEAPATRLRKLKHLIFSLLNEEYTPYRNEVEFQCVFDAYSRFLGNTKIIASPTSAPHGDSTRGILTMTVMEVEIHELKHLGDPLVLSEILKKHLSGVACDSHVKRNCFKFVHRSVRCRAIESLHFTELLKCDSRRREDSSEQSEWSLARENRE